MGIPFAAVEFKGKLYAETLEGCIRVEQKTDYEKLVLEITTDGSIHPKEALKEAAKILIYHFMLFQFSQDDYW